MSIGGLVTGVIGLLSKGADIWRALIARGERKANEDAGANRERLKQAEASLGASREMRGIEDEVTDLPDDKRRDLARRFVRPSRRED